MVRFCFFYEDETTVHGDYWRGLCWRGDLSMWFVLLLGNQYLNFTRTDVADPLVLVSGNLYLIILLLYPLEIVRPGWLSLKRVGIVLLPYVSVTLLYYIVLFLLGQKILVLHNIGQLIEHIGEFNVWYRLLMTLSIIIYLAFLFRLTCRYQKFYQQWCCNNYSDD